jgi:hypothetical protein
MTNHCQINQAVLPARGPGGGVRLAAAGLA